MHARLLLRQRLLPPALTARAAVALTLLALGVTLSGASAQIDPDDSGGGTKLGLAAFANSGQVGTVTLFALSPQRTLVLIHVYSVAPSKIEPARIRRARSCRASSLVNASAALVATTGGRSRSVVDIGLARLLSGSYVLEVFDRRGGGRVSCGDLVR